MKINNHLLIFVYFSCLIMLSIILFSLMFNNITKELLGNFPVKNKIYYWEIFLIWIILVYIIFNIKNYVNYYGKNNIKKYIMSNEKNIGLEYIDNEIDEIMKFDILIISGFIAIFLSSKYNNYNEKLTALNEDIGIISEVF